EIPSREIWNQDPDALVSHGFLWFTNGSKTLEGTGAGVRGVRPRVELSFPLGKHISVFQAKMFAILTCSGCTACSEISEDHFTSGGHSGGLVIRVQVIFSLGLSRSHTVIHRAPSTTGPGKNVRRTGLGGSGALHALKSPRVTSQVVLECTNSLAALGQRNKLRLVWAPGHSGVASNEEAGALARKG
ncbi:hypothetical protein NQ315_002436, partial [Exocentrus adspersus]